MKNANRLKLVLVTAASFAIALAEPMSVAQEVTVRPPAAATRPVIDDYFGTSVSDSYRWMEDSNSAELDQWMRQQNEYARNVLGRIRVRSELLRRIDALSEQGPDARRMHLAQGQLFYLKRGAGDSAFKLIVRDRRGQERTLVDPEQQASHETHYSIDFFKSSPNGRYVAYGMSAGGSEDSVIHVVEVSSGKELPEAIDRAGGNRGMIQTIVWHPNSKAFFYNRGRPRTAEMSRADFQLRTRAYMHVLATDPNGDPALLGFDISPSLPFTDIDSPHIYAAPGSPYAVGLVYHGVRSEVTLYTARLDQIRGADTPWRKVVDVDDAVTHFAIKDSRVYLLTHKDASRSKVIVVSLRDSTAVDAKVVVPPSEAVRQRIAVAKDALYIRALDGGIGRVKRFDFASTKLSDVPLPFDGSVQEIVTDPKRPGVVFKTEGWTQSSRFLRYFPQTGTVKNTGAIPPDRKSVV